MDRCAALLRIETQELASLSEAQSTAVTHNAQELYVAMVQLANHLHQVTHDLHHHHQRYCRLGKATTSCSAALALTKKKKIEKKKSSAKSCEHCSRTSSSAWRRGPDYCLYAWKNTKRSMSVQALLN
ncbi:uncharacterized protein ACA1_378930 [Acanthamoeba castellanii str. Neff]|uniref:Uncharacterized protein n=1 Tax=Acanthamoeba castellanii (strain ATCC 30010 / Neff) TaxID=1257118 RepID=L8GS24_ACACF|nr:uncharacterized protein ACA1_378930 [Acanthamoeba castellanii str. Neff]ELR15722.1 hypothetical protein ACA1_378930 [Acanthamoeba castellanii str. Neff]